MSRHVATALLSSQEAKENALQLEDSSKYDAYWPHRKCFRAATMLHINVMQLCMHVIPILGLFNWEASLSGTGSLKDIV